MSKTYVTGVIIGFLVCVFFCASSSPAETIKLKFVQTIHADAAAESFLFPEGIGCRDATVLIADSGNRRILRYTYQGGTLKYDAQFPVDKTYPIMAQSNSKGEIHVLDSRQRRIAVLTPEGAPRGILKATDAPGADTVVPKSMRIDSADRIYLLDIFSARVLVLNPEGKFERAVPFPASHGFISDLDVDRHGTIYLVDSIEAIVYKAGKEDESFTALTGGLKDYMNFPTNLSVSADGTIFLLDQYGSGLAAVAPDGSFLGRKMGMGWSDGFLHYPSGICSNEGGIFIADRNNNRVQQFSIAP